ncbi:MAG TPA: glycosyltransferase [Nocardioidaceae bacterium]|nr:glycosyltransferase [Nocardioidaceae bacterium]
MTSHDVMILVGTDHHPFERLVAWADRRQLTHPEDRVTIQYGDSRAPAVATGHSFLHRDELQQRVQSATVVITHGGPGTIMDVRAAGHRPIVITRDPAQGEHVDNHQMLFGDWCRSKGLVRLLRDVDGLDGLIESLGTDGTRDPSAAVGTSTRQTVHRLERLLDDDRGARPRAPGATRLVYVTGTAARGLALLASALEHSPGVVLLRDVAGSWPDRRDRDDRLCDGAGEGGDFWAAIGERAFGGWDHAPTERVLDLQRALNEPSRLLRAARRHPGAVVRQLLVDHAQLHRRVYTAAAELAGARVVIDAGGSATTALALSHDAHLDLRVAFVGHAADVGRRDGTVRTGWLTERAAVRALAYRGVPVLRLGPGGPGSDPTATLRRMWAPLGLPGAPPSTEPQQSPGDGAHDQARAELETP